MRKLTVYFLPLLFLCTIQSRAQKLVLDTLIIHLNPVLPESIDIPVSIDSVMDLRTVDNPCLLSIDEIKQYAVIPVDRHILSAKPLAQVVQQALPFTPDSDTHISLGIRHLEFDKQTHFLFLNRSTLTASVQFICKGHTTPAVFYYEISFDRFYKNPPLRASYQKNFTRFIHDLAADLSAYSSTLSSKHDNPAEYHPGSPWYFLHTGSDIIYTFSGYLIDGYLYFSHPETQRTALRTGGVLRYRHENDFESLEYKLANDLLYYRLNKIAAIRLKSQLLLGINRWKDVNRVKHELYDAVIVDLSLAQSIHYFPVNRKTILLGVGIQESLYYIYSHGFQFQAGLLFHVGIQL